MGVEPVVEKKNLLEEAPVLETGDVRIEQEPAVEAEKMELPEQELTAEEREEEVRALREAEQLAPVASGQYVIPKDPVLMDVEQMLSDGLADIYRELPESKKATFKEKGEEIAYVVKGMIDQGRISASKILQLIRTWLRMIPGVNAFFLEQEAKIKADKLIDYANDRLARGSEKV